jgi:cytochrome P450
MGQTELDTAAGTSQTNTTDYPIPPDVPMRLIPRLRALRVFHTGTSAIRDAGGPVSMVRLGPERIFPPFVVVTSPRGARDVLGGSDGAFDKEGQIHIESRALGANVFNLPHEPWLARRRALQPLFTKKHVADYGGHMAGSADTLVREWIDRTEIDLDQECRRLTLQVIGRSVFGLDLGDRAESLGPPIQSTLRYVTGRSTRPLRAPRWLPTPARRRLRSSLATVHAVINEAIDAAREDPDRDAPLIHLLLDTPDPQTGRQMTQQAIADELLVFLVAGHDTTATTLAYSLWAVGRHPAVQERLATEVAAIGDRALTVDDVQRLPHTVRVVHEALRLCPPAAALTRMTMRDTVVDGFRIPRGTNVVVGVYTLHRDRELWQHPELFDPDRFAPERSVGRDRWQYLPFGGGPRTCIGDHFAMLEATLGLASIVRVADIEALNSDFPVALPFTMTAAGPVPARLSRRI